jgi:ribonuclease P protein component
MLRRSWRVPADMLKDARGFARRSSPFFTVRMRPNGLSHPRFAVVLGIRVDRRATSRHSLKRRILAHLRRAGAGPDHQGALRRNAGRDIIVSVHPRTRALPRKDLYAELNKFLIHVRNL